MISTIPPVEIPKIQIVEQAPRQYLAPVHFDNITEATYYEAEHGGLIIKDVVLGGFTVVFSPK